MNEIDPHTRDNPESAMVNRQHQNLLPSASYQPTPFQQVQCNPWPWPISVSQCGEHNAFLGSLQKEPEKSDQKAERARETFDSEAHRAFMRSLG